MDKIIKKKDKQWSTTTLHRKVKIELHEAHCKPGVDSSLAVPPPLVIPIMLLINDTINNNSVSTIDCCKYCYITDSIYCIHIFSVLWIWKGKDRKDFTFYASMLLLVCRYFWWTLLLCSTILCMLNLCILNVDYHPSVHKS
jgi:hypothetical protein